MPWWVLANEVEISFEYIFWIVSNMVMKLGQLVDITIVNIFRQTGIWVILKSQSLPRQPFGIIFPRSAEFHVASGYSETSSGSVLKKYTIFTGKHLCWESLCNKVVGLQVCHFIKKRFQHKCFPVNVSEISCWDPSHVPKQPRQIKIKYSTREIFSVIQVQ